MTLARVVCSSCVFILSAIVCESALSAEWLKDLSRAVHEPFERVLHERQPRSPQDTAMECLAREIDWLEHHIDAYGTVVAKQPNIWGEARMTKHRDEYERQMLTQLHEFQVKMNAALRRSDMAYLGLAFALQQGFTSQNPANVSAQLTDAKNVFNNVVSMTPSPTSEPGGTVTAIEPGKPFELGTLAGDKRAFEFDPKQISLEPVIGLDQLSRYLNHLHELRRLNEGDDTADSPGYSLNLVRIPVSVLPGKKTRKGYGAEITVTATPYLCDELLPTTFRSLIVNDLVDQLGLPITSLLNFHDSAEIKRLLEKFASLHDKRSDVRNQRNRLDAAPETASNRAARSELANTSDNLTNEIQDIEAILATAIRQSETLAIPTLDFSRSRTSSLPLAPSQLLDVFGSDLFLHMAAGLQRAFQADVVNRDLAHLMDVEGALQTELIAAYELLSQPNEGHGSWAAVSERNANPAIWRFADRQLVQAIRTRDNLQIKKLRDGFLNELAACFGVDGHSSDAAMAWAVIVESALLNDRLIQDMLETASAKGCPCWTDAAISFAGPFPEPPARQAFNEYVRCRWPIHVFALDPVTQDQNIGDEFGRRRELQLALSMAFTTGQVNAQTMMRFARRLEWDMATIALNRTVVGFSHGSDTFGWRFYPRFQTPPIEGNLAAFGQTLFGGPTRDQDMNQRELESGFRECTAIVLMPGFVPNCTIDVRSNWFRLTNPKQTEISVQQTMELSRAITAMRWSAAECARCAHSYRPEELGNMLKRVDQLDRELPLQTMLVPMPYENTLGGFEMFNTGITDLAPELRGWYGAPGLHPNQPTTLYLVGDHFSVHSTRVIAGADALQYRMISRQLLEVQFPAGMRLLSAPHRDRYFDAFVDAHVATPYGVSSHLLIPVVRDDSMLGAGQPRWLPQTIRLTYSVTGTGEEQAATIDASYPLPSVRLAIAFPVSAYPQATLNVTCAMASGDAHLGSLTTFGTELDARRGVYVVPDAALKTTIDNSAKAKLERYLTYRLRRNELSGKPLVVRVTGAFDRTAPAPQTEILGEFQIELQRTN